jgi:diguanylate cyclase (GGDEF)-like protein
MQRIVRISDKYQSELHEIREKFEQEAKLDYLTGLANRREMYRILETEIKRIDRYGGTFSLILFDFDQFKDTNDKYGHEVGDKILQKASILIQEKLRQQDVCARWGGEEFLVIQPEGSAEGVFHCAERLRKALVDNPLMYGSVKINISISLGIALYRKGESLEECLLRADKSLYAAKAGGRNRTGPLDV